MEMQQFDKRGEEFLTEAEFFTTVPTCSVCHILTMTRLVRAPPYCTSPLLSNRSIAKLSQECHHRTTLNLKLPPHLPSQYQCKLPLVTVYTQPEKRRYFTSSFAAQHVKNKAGIQKSPPPRAESSQTAHISTKRSSFKLSENQRKHLKYLIPSAERILTLFSQRGNPYLSKEDILQLELSLAKSSHDGHSIPRRQLLRLIHRIRSMLRRGLPQPLNTTHKELIQHTIRKHMTTTPPGGDSKDQDDTQDHHTSSVDIPAVCRDLEKQLNFTKVQLYKVVYNEIDWMKRRNVTRKQRNFVRKFVVENLRQNGDDTSNLSSHSTNGPHTKQIPNIASHLCDRLQELASPVTQNISRSQLYQLVQGEIKNLKRRKITSFERRLISDHVSKHDSQQTASEMCDILLQEHSKQFETMPRKQLYEYVLQVQRYVSRKYLTRDRYIAMCRHIQKSKHPQNYSLLCEELMNHKSFSSISRAQLYHLIRQEVERLEKREVTQEERSFIQKHVQTHASDDIIKLCDDIQKQVDLPRKRIYQLVHQNINSAKLCKFSPEEREYLQNFILEALKDRPIEAYRGMIVPLCDELQKNRFSRVTRSQLYQNVYRRVRKYETDRRKEAAGK